MFERFKARSQTASESSPLNSSLTQQETRRRRDDRAAFTLAFVLGVFLFLITSVTGVFNFAELRAYDQMFKLRNEFQQPTPPSNIVIVAIDEASMEAIDQRWPWPRTLHAQLVDQLHAAGAGVIVFDVLFSESSLASSDAEFARAIRRAGNVVLAQDYEIRKDTNFTQTGTVPPVRELSEAAQRLGVISLTQDADGFVRRTLLERGGEPILAQAVAEMYLKNMEGTAQKKQWPDGILINYLGEPRTVKTVSYHQALNFKTMLPKGIFENKIVLIGRDLAVVPNLSEVDHFLYPFFGSESALIPGVEIHASIIDTLLRERFLAELPFILQFVAFCLVLGGSLFLMWKLSPWLGAGAYLLSILGALTAQFVLFLHGNWVTDVAGPVIIFALIFIAERGYRVVSLDRRRRFVKRAFKSYVSANVVEELLANPERISNEWAEECETTVLFTDLAGFTALTEKYKHDPKEFRRLLTDYFTVMVDVMQKHNGTLDKFIGDAMMCYYGVPIANEKHPIQACMTALEMQQRLTQLNQEWVGTRIDEKLGMRIGLNSGDVVAGNMGARRVLNFTIMGDTVNLGARLESANKQYGTHIMISEFTYQKTQGRFDVRRLDRIQVKGKNEPVTVYELLGLKGTLDPEKARFVECYERAFSLYLEKKFVDAASILSKEIDDQGTDPDPSYLSLRDRCLKLESEDLPENWSGEFRMETK